MALERSVILLRMLWTNNSETAVLVSILNNYHKLLARSFTSHRCFICTKGLNTNGKILGCSAGSTTNMSLFLHYVFFFSFLFVVLLGFLLLYFRISVNKFVLSLLYFRKSVLFLSQ